MAQTRLPAWRSPHDRVSLTELLTCYEQPLQELGQKFEKAFAAHPASDPQVLDNIFILRYLLSKKGDAAAAATAIQAALDWRRENLPLIHAASELTKPPSMSQESLQKINCYMTAGIHTPTSYGDLVFIIRAACMNINELMNDLDSLSIYIMYLWEVCYQYCDKESRERGYFVKLYVVNDMNGFSPNPLVMKKFGAVMGDQSKRSEFLYPQLLGMMCAVNAPSVINFIFKLISPLMSKGFVEKFHIHGEVTPDSSRIAAKDLPLPFKGDDAAVMPSFIGGRCECEGGCIGHNVSNILPPPAKKTAKDLPGAASLSTFVQVRYLQRQRERAAQKEVQRERAAQQELQKGSATAAVDTTSTQYPNLLSSARHEVRAELEKRAETTESEPWENLVIVNVIHEVDTPPVPCTTSISKLPSERSKIQVQTEQEQVQTEQEQVTPAMTCKGLFVCL